MSALTALTRTHSLKSAQKYGQSFIMPSSALVSALKPANELGWDNNVGVGG